MRSERGAPVAASGPLADLAGRDAWPRLAAALDGWIPRQRWFQGKARVVTGVRVADAAVLDGDPPVLDLLVDVAYSGWQGERYQVPLLSAGDDAGATAGVVASVDGHRLLDALTDEAACRVLAGSAIGAGRVASVAGSALRGLPVTTGAAVPDGKVRPMGVEQTNSSVVIGDAVLKVFRKLEEGANPDVELTRALTTAGFGNVPAQRAALVLEREGTQTTLAVLSDFASGAREGWALACAEAAAVARGEVGGEVAATAGELGEVVARMHVALREVLGSHDAGSSAAAWASEMRHQLAGVAALAREHASGPAAPVLARIDEIATRFDELARTADAGPLVRIHGDLHLGQVLRHDGRWVILDFEGEPARPLAERRRPQSPLRDVAGMVRSFDYAAAHADAALPPALGDWRDRLRRRFLDGYLGVARPAGLLPAPGAAQALLDAFELDKAVYEIGYELANRPSWVATPVGGILRVLDGR